MIRRTIHYSGRVQGVGFRATVHTLAAGRAVTGFVRNMPDGRVEAVYEGEPTDVDGLTATVLDRMGANVERTDVREGRATGEFRSFEVRR